jgi:hypothetical protein
LLPRFQGGAHRPDIRVYGLDGNGRHAGEQLTLEEPLAYLGVL